MKRLLLILFSASLIAHAQDDPLEDHFVPPELLMKHQSELGITPAQREEIKEQVRNAQIKFTELQWDIQAEMEVLSNLLEDRNVSEGPVIEQLNKVLEVEADIKRTQVSMLIALRKVLTDEQLDQARGLRYAGGLPSPRQIRELKRTAEAAQKRAVVIQKRAVVIQKRAEALQREMRRKAVESPQGDK